MVSLMGLRTVSSGSVMAVHLFLLRPLTSLRPPLLVTSLRPPLLVASLRLLLLVASLPPSRLPLHPHQSECLN